MLSTWASNNSITFIAPQSANVPARIVLSCKHENAKPCFQGPAADACSSWSLEQSVPIPELFCAGRVPPPWLGHLCHTPVRLLGNAAAGLPLALAARRCSDTQPHQVMGMGVVFPCVLLAGCMSGRSYLCAQGGNPLRVELVQPFSAFFLLPGQQDQWLCVMMPLPCFPCSP
jgi:hypothetical protein